tara:strand:- start:416 stop:907 length:492 start_codon:yes stop_codon:yes gene_type:complete
MYKIHNVLSNNDRKKFIKDVKPFLRQHEDVNNNFYPGKQTSANLHEQPMFASLMNSIIDKIRKETKLNLGIYRSWVKWSNGKSDQTNWHHHYVKKDTSFTAVYYLKTLPFFSNGTLFEDGFVRAPQNSMIIYPSTVLHATPAYPFPFIDRYVMSIDLNFMNPE